MSKKIEIVVARRLSDDGIEYSSLPIEHYFGTEDAGMNQGAIRGEKALSHSFVMDSFRKIMGRTLTIIDASISEKQQNKAMKDLVRSIFSEEMDFAAEMAFDQKEFSKMVEEGLEAVDLSQLKTITLDEVLGVKGQQ